MKFTAIVREQKSAVRTGKINSVKLLPYAGKLVLITVEVVTPSTKLPPITGSQTPSAPKTG